MHEAGVDLAPNLGADGARRRSLRRQDQTQPVVATKQTEVFECLSRFASLIAEEFLCLVDRKHGLRNSFAKGRLKPCSNLVVAPFDVEALLDLRRQLALAKHSPNQHAR